VQGTKDTASLTYRSGCGIVHSRVITRNQDTILDRQGCVNGRGSRVFLKVMGQAKQLVRRCGPHHKRHKRVTTQRGRSRCSRSHWVTTFKCNRLETIGAKTPTA
jgi:hypothetical protein